MTTNNSFARLMPLGFVHAGTTLGGLSFA